MKKMFCILIVVLTLLSLAACGNASRPAATTTPEQETQKPISKATEPAKEPSSSPTVQESDNTEQPTSTPATESTTDTTESKTTPTSSEPDIDVDLTQLSSTMVYSEVYSMMVSPEEYIGKTIRMRGQFAIGYSYNQDGSINESSLRYACIIMDATACCAQGIEFVLSGDHIYPDDYPELDSEITVTGRFETYDEYGILYCQLADATLSE